VELIVFRVTLQQWLGILHTVGRTNTGAILVYTENGGSLRSPYPTLN